MLGLSVQRQDGPRLEPGAGVPVFYDEKLRVRVHSELPCEVHLCVTVVGSFEERGREHSVVIFDENLDWACEWTQDVHVRHPRSPLQSPHLEIVATARYTAPDAAAGANGHAATAAAAAADRAKYVQAFEPVALGAASAIVPFAGAAAGASSGGGGGAAAARPAARHARGASTASGIDFAEAYEERRNSRTGETVSTRREPRARAPQPEDADIRVVRWRQPLSQALELEIRSIRPALERDRVIAEIDLVAGALPVSVAKCDVTLEDGLVDLMGAFDLPLQLAARGKFAMCFNLQVRAAPQPLNVPVSRRPLNIALEGTVLVGATAPRITTMWTPLVDFEGTQGPLPKTPALTLPANSPLMPGHAGNAPPSASSSTLDLVGSGSRSQLAKTSLGLMGGVSILVSGPQFVTVGDRFEWSFKVLNRSQRARAFTLKFATAQPRDASMRDSRLELPVPPANTPGGMPATGPSLLTMPGPEQLRRRAQAHYSSIGASRGIIPLCQELRVGSLAPHTCFETSIELYAHKPGTHSVESTRIEDLSNRDSYEVGGLLEVIVLPRA